MIEHMSDIITSLAQFIYILWPIFIVTAFGYSFQGPGGKGWWKSLLRRMHSNLLFTWLVLFVIWVVTLFASLSTPTLLPEPYNSILFFSGFVLVILIEINRLRVLPSKILARIDLQEVQAIEMLSQMAPAHFEELVAETYRALGYKAVRTGQSGDHGIDVEMVTPNGERWIIQCKRYRDSVGEAVVRELYGTLVSEKAERGILVTSAEITPPAEKWARGKPIDLIDGQQFLRLMERARKKTQGTLFDRLVSWFRIYSSARSIPAGLRSNKMISASLEKTRPNRANRPMQHDTASLPLCPKCGTSMVPHPVHQTRKLFRCSNYPDCRVVIEDK